jgi:PAS domain S-box-containing protein
MRVGTYLLWLVLAISIPLLLFTGGTVWRVQKQQWRQQEVALVDQATDASQPIDRSFVSLETGLSVLAGSSALGQRDLDSFGREMRLYSHQLGDIPIILTAPNGDVVLRTGGPQSASVANDEAAREAAHASMRARQAIVTNLLPSADRAYRTVAVAVPASRPAETTPAYVLVAILDTTRLAALAEVPPFSPDGLVLTIRDRDGVIVARSLHPEQHLGEPASAGLQQAIAGRRSGLLPDATTLEGVPAVRAFRIAATTGFMVLAALPRGTFGAVIRRDLIEIVSIGLVLLVLGLLAATYLAHRLVVALRAVGHDHRAAAPCGLREVDELANRLRAVSAEREATQATLRDSESRLRDLVGTLDLAAIMARELKGTIRFWSHGCEKMYGWTRDEAVGQSSHALLRTQFPVPLVQIDHALMTQGEWKGDLVHRRRDGTSIIVAAHKALKRDADGQPSMVVESLVDVTPLRDAQDALHALNQQLEQRVQEEIAAREAAQRRAAHTDRIQALGQLAGGIAHDFNNVLQAVAGGAALIARQPFDTERVVRLIQLVSDAAARGASITRRMLLLVRRGDLVAEPVEPETLLEGMREVFIHTLGPAISVRVEIEPDLPRLMADRAQLETALVNLATNARDAMLDGGMLWLAAALESVDPAVKSHPSGLPPGLYVRLSVIDDGTGMSEATMARAGEPFFTTKDVGKGTGLGLSMVKGFADQSNGGFVLGSTVGVGTTATLWLPVVVGELIQLFINPADQSRSRPGLILLVDDDAQVRDTLVEQLEELGHKVLAASGGTDALAILRAREAVDLMITDLSMPGMDGLALIKHAQGLRPSLPAILLTGYAGDAMALESSGVPKDTYTLMRKPASTAALNARVSAMLERL